MSVLWHGKNEWSLRSLGSSARKAARIRRRAAADRAVMRLPSRRRPVQLSPLADALAQLERIQIAAQRFLGNTRVDLCSRVLKREPMRAWLEANRDPADTVVHLGFDISEEHRIHRAAPHWEPWRVEAPLCWEPVIWKDQALAALAAAGIEPPLLTREGFPHANCGGGCVKAGIGQFTRLYHDHPDTYAEWERQEEEMRAYLGKDISILRDRRGGEVRPLTLRSLRVRMEDERSLFSLLDADEGDSCNCMGDYGEVPVEIGGAS